MALMRSGQGRVVTDEPRRAGCSLAHRNLPPTLPLAKPRERRQSAQAQSIEAYLSVLLLPGFAGGWGEGGVRSDRSTIATRFLSVRSHGERAGPQRHACFPQLLWMPSEQPCGQARFHALSSITCYMLIKSCACMRGFPQRLWMQRGQACGKAWFGTCTTSTCYALIER